MAEKLDKIEKEFSNEEDRIKIARARAEAQRRRQSASETTGGGAAFNDFTGQLNTGIARVLGAPVDLINTGLGKVGVPVSDEPILGSQNIKNVLSATPTRPKLSGPIKEMSMFGQPGMGIDFAEGDPETTPGYIGRGVGESVAALLPFVAVSRAFTGGRGIVGAAARSIDEALTKYPISSVMSEIGAGIGIGVGGKMTEDEDPSTQATGEIIGGLAGALGPTAITRGTSALSGSAVDIAEKSSQPLVSLLGKTIKSVQRSIPGTEIGSLRRAEQRMQSLTPDPEKAAKLALEDTISNLSPATKAGDKRLLALEREVLRRSPALDDEFSNAAKSAEVDLKRAIQSNESASDTRAFLESRLNRLRKSIDARIEQSLAESRSKIEKIGPGVDRAQASKIVRDELETAFDNARAQEKQLWDMVPKNEQVPTDKTFGMFESLKSELSGAEQEDIPEIARRFLDLSNEKTVFGASESVKELRGLYSKLGQVRTNALKGDNQNRNTARIADKIRAAILDDLGSVDPATELGAKINQARAFSADINRKFRTGPIGKMFALAGDGGEKLAAELTLDATIGRGDIPGDLQFKQIVESLEIMDPDGAKVAKDAIADFLRKKFMESSVQGNTLNRSKANTFIQKNRPILDQFPDLRDSLIAADRAQDVADNLGKGLGAISKDLDNPNKYVATKFIEAPIEKEVDRIFSAPNPAETTRALIRNLSKDESGKALKGFKSAMVDNIIERSTVKTADGSIVSGAEMKRLLLGLDKEGRRVQSTLHEAFDPGEIKRLNQVADELEKLALRSSNLPDMGGRIIDDFLSVMIEVPARIFAANRGASLGKGYGSLQTSQMASSRTKKFLQNLSSARATKFISDAMQEPELFAALMRGEGSTATQKKDAWKNINSWLAGPGARLMSGIEDEEEIEDEAPGPESEVEIEPVTDQEK